MQLNVFYYYYYYYYYYYLFIYLFLFLFFFFLVDPGGAIRFERPPNSLTISYCYFERNKDNNNQGNDIYETGGQGGFTNAYSRSDSQRHSSRSIDSPPSITSLNTPLLVEVDGSDIYSCYTTSTSKCRSISFCCLAQFNDGNYNIEVGDGRFYESAIKASSDGKVLNIEGSGTGSTFIIGSIFLNNNGNVDPSFTLDSHTSLFFSSGSNSLSVKKLTIYISFGSRNIFRHDSSGSFSVEEIVIKPLNLFLEVQDKFDVGIFLLNSALTSIKSIIANNIKLGNIAIFEFPSSTFPLPITFENNSFYDIDRTGLNGGSVLAFNVPNSLLVEVIKCQVIIYLFFFLFFFFNNIK
jgi:hypothetical protein